MKIKNFIRKSFIFGLSMSLFLPQKGLAFAESSTIESFINRRVLVPLIKPSWGNFIIHAESLNKLYSLRSYQAIWIGQDGMPNAQVQVLKKIFQSADRHGLITSDYWDIELESLYNAVLKNQNNWITFELAASEALIRYASHLSTGRFDPMQIDTDIKFKRKIFADYQLLQNAVSADANLFLSQLDSLAPTHLRYRDLQDALVQLKNIQATDSWNVLKSPSVKLQLGSTDPLIPLIRSRFNLLGYKISNTGGNNFDNEFDAVLRSYQAANGLKSDGIIGTKSEVIRRLNMPLAKMITQVELNMEKLRWLPKEIESRHIFVNLGMTEFKLQDAGKDVFNFKTVNGAVLHRTPSMRDSINFVNLNPTWTMPSNLVINEALPKLQKDPGYIERNDMVLLDARSGSAENPYDIDWYDVNPKQFPYIIRQNPSYNNSLGVVKFPLQNPWAIYLHDTNERHLFAESERHLSHGCIRLEKPLELAAYLLQDQAPWSLEYIKSFVPNKSGEQGKELEKKVNLARPMPVYTLYLTAEKNNGALRFVDDVYGQDYRLAKALGLKMSSTDSSAGTSAGQGSLKVTGVAGKFQIFSKVRAVRCDLSRRGACDPAIVLNKLNEAQSVPAGDYFISFENSIYPGEYNGAVRVSAGRVTELFLEKRTFPESLQGKKLRVYRDFSNSGEQQKIMQTVFHLNHHLQRLDKDNFGDLYEAGSWEKDFVQRFNYDFCSKIDAVSSYSKVDGDALDKCAAWNRASDPQDLSPLFQFNQDSTFNEFWVTSPGDVISLKHPRYLVSAPLMGSDFISVFPGAYKYQVEGEAAEFVLPQ